MTAWAQKRFWKEATLTEQGAGWGIALDGRMLRTPAKAALTVPSRALAEAIAAEWQAQGEKIAPSTMPLTRTANSAIDKVEPQRAAVAAMLAEYGETDLLCYRADAPAELQARQSDGWDPILDWFADAAGVRLGVTQGIRPISQSDESIRAMAEQVALLDAWKLSAFHDFVTISGSLVLGFALAAGRIHAEDVWNLSRIDEDWQAEQWGHDEEAQSYAAQRRQALLDAERFWTLLETNI